MELTNPNPYLAQMAKREQDWYAKDKDLFHRNIRDIGRTNINGWLIDNTFCRACIYTTSKFMPWEFFNISERHIYYDFLNFYLSKLNSKLSGVRFFAAAASVTKSTQVGAVETLQGDIFKYFKDISEETIRILSDINKKLFHDNMKILSILIFKHKYPFEFLASNNTYHFEDKPKEISTIDFDIQMVKMEQSIVESYIRDNPKLFTEKIKTDLNNYLNTSLDSVLNTINELDSKNYINPKLWAKTGLNIENFDFLQYRHRFALGTAYVFSLHKKLESEYLTFIKSY